MASGAGRARQHTFYFEEFELDLSAQTLSKGGVRVKLQRQPFQVLELLVVRAPAIVSREEIRQHIWGDAVYVDATQSINFCIRQIRLALGETSAGPRCIETLPRQGYRFIAPVGGLRANTPVRESAPAPAVPPEHAKRRFSRRTFAIAAFLALGAIAALFTRFWQHSSSSAVLRISSVTTYPGDEREPSLSPDGRQVAFSWNGETGENRDIYIKALGELRPVRLTSDPAEDSYPAWSPDGRQIAFIRRRLGTRAEIITVPTVGGREHKLREISLGSWTTSHVLTWTPDGKWLCFTDMIGTAGHHTLFLLSSDSGTVRRFLPEEENGMGDSSPAFSPDGKWLAFARFQHPFNSKLLLQRLSAGPSPRGAPMAVENAGVNPRAPVWTSDSRKLFFLDQSRIMEAEIGGSAHPFYLSSSPFGELTFTPSRRRLVASLQNFRSEIWMMTLGANGLKARRDGRRILESSAGQGQPRYSPDGRSLAFVSDRSGSAEVWVADSNGRNPRQLTHQSFYIAGYVRWSSDSQSLAFHARLPDDPQIYVARLADGSLRQVTHGSPGFMAPSWAKDNLSLYADALENGNHRTYRIPVSGGTPQRLFEGAGAIELPARNLLVYEKEEQSGIYSRSLSGDVERNQEHLLVADYHTPWGGFYPVDDGLYYASCTPTGTCRPFRFYSFDSGKSIEVAPSGRSLDIGLAVSPDRTRLAYAEKSLGNEDLVAIDIN